MFGRRRTTQDLERRLAALERGRGHRPAAGAGASPDTDAPVLTDGHEHETRASHLWGDGLGAVATRALQIIIVLALTALFVLGLQALSVVVIPVLLALIFASTFAPVTRWLADRNFPPALSAALLLLAIVLILTGIGWLIVWAVRDQWDELGAQAQVGFTQIVDWLHTLPFMPSDGKLTEQLAELQKQAVHFLTSSQFGSGALAGVGAVTNFVTGFILMVVVLFFLLKDGPKIWRFVTRPFAGASLDRANRVGLRTVQTLGSYVRGTAAVAFVDAAGIGIGLVILGVPLALPLSVLVFVTAFIPIVGATIAGILAALVALVANGPLSALLVVGVVVLVNQLEGNFLQPVLMGRALKLHSLVILLALTIGTVLGGILGAILAVPIAAVAWGAIKVWDGPDLPAKWARPRKNEDA